MMIKAVLTPGPLATAAAPTMLKPLGHDERHRRDFPDRTGESAERDEDLTPGPLATAAAPTMLKPLGHDERHRRDFPDGTGKLAERIEHLSLACERPVSDAVAAGAPDRRAFLRVSGACVRHANLVDR